jgi:CheY-like chemotaxis protein
VKEIRILLVENDDFIRGLIVDSLKELGHHITALKTPPEALNYLQTSEIDLLMSAYFLPTMDGLELARQARQHKPQLRIALVTGYGRDLINEAVQSGLIDLVIRGPLRTSVFKDSIKTVFEKRT